MTHRWKGGGGGGGFLTVEGSWRRGDGERGGGIEKKYFINGRREGEEGLLL